MADRSQVFLVGASDEVNGAQKLLDEFDLHTEGTIALKANYNSDDPFPATTNPEILWSVGTISEEELSQPDYGRAKRHGQYRKRA